MQHRTNNVIMKVICSISVHVQKLILFVYVYMCILINLMFLFFSPQENVRHLSDISMG